MASAVIKFKFNDELRRFALPRTAGFSELRAKIAALTGVNAEDLVISYTDEDNDAILLTTDGEIAELLTFNEVVRLDVSRKTAAASSPSSRTSSASLVDVAAPAPAVEEPLTVTAAAESSAAPDVPVAVDVTSQVVVEEVSESDSDSDDDEQEDAPTEPSAIAKSKQPERATQTETAASSAASSASSASSATPSASSAPAEPEQPTHRPSGSIYEELQALWSTFVERNQDLFERAGNLQEELVHAMHTEAEERRRKYWEARRQAYEEHARLVQQRREECKAACQRRWAAYHAQQQQQQQPERAQRGHCGRFNRGCHPQPAQSSVRIQPEDEQRERLERRQRNLAALAELGFFDERLNSGLLDRFHDSVGRVADQLLNSF